MAELYGMANQILSEMLTRLMTDSDFSKFVYYKSEKDEDILSMKELDDPITTLYNKQVWLHRRPQKVLHNEDVNVFLCLENFKNENAKNKKIKTMTFKIGILCHDNCLDTANGSRPVAILECVERLLEEDSYFNSLGELRVTNVGHLFGLNLEYSGFEITCKIDGIKVN